MSKNGIISLVIIIIALVIGGILWYQSAKAPETTAPAGSEEQSQSITGGSESQTGERAEGDAQTGGEAAPQTATVLYTANGFLPKSLTVKKGTTVIFKNERDTDMWVASAMHPSHAAYPTTGGCIGSTFDACKGYKKGELWSFKFDIAGEWRYHDHLNASQFGAVTVTE